jgi:hypothetical protein
LQKKLQGHIAEGMSTKRSVGWEPITSAAQSTTFLVTWETTLVTGPLRSRCQ